MSPDTIQAAGGGSFYGKKRADGILVCLVVAAVMLITVAVNWTLGQIESQIKAQTTDSLQTIVATTQESIGLWVDTLKKPVSIIASRAEIVSAVKALIRVPPQPASLRKNPALRDLRQFLGPVLDLYKYDFVVVNPDRIRIAAETDDQVGKKVSETIDDRPIQAALMGHISFSLSAVDSPNPSEFLIVASPITDESNHVLAALVFFLDPRDDFNLVTHFGRIGASGETYVFDRNGRMLTSSRFGADRTLYIRPVGQQSGPRPLTTHRSRPNDPSFVESCRQHAEIYAARR
jgi:hypothetical protein